MPVVDHDVVAAVLLSNSSASCRILFFLPTASHFRFPSRAAALASASHFFHASVMGMAPLRSTQATLLVSRIAYQSVRVKDGLSSTSSVSVFGGLCALA